MGPPKQGPLQPSASLTGPLDLLHLFGVSGHPATALHDQQDRRGRDHHHTLPVLPGTVSGTLSSQLDLAVPDREFL